jgi:hypothetical protein
MSHENHAEKISNSDGVEYVVPSKAILTQDDLEIWKESATHQAIVDYIGQLNSSVINKKLTDTIHESEVGNYILNQY